MEGATCPLWGQRLHTKSGLQMGVYEDNFGFWDIDGPEERALFEHVQRQSVCINCERCERSVRLILPKTLCATCVSALEYGAPSSMNEYGYSQTRLLDPRRPPRWDLRFDSGHASPPPGPFAAPAPNTIPLPVRHFDINRRARAHG